MVERIPAVFEVLDERFAGTGGDRYVDRLTLRARRWNCQSSSRSARGSASAATTDFGIGPAQPVPGSTTTVLGREVEVNHHLTYSDGICGAGGA